MAAPVFVSGAANIKQTHTVTIALTWATGDTITLTIDNVTFVVTIGALVTTTQVATTLKQAFNGETLTDTTASSNIAVGDGGAQALGAFAELVATSSSAVVTLTARTAGKPFTMTTGDVASTAGDGTATVATATVNAGAAEADNVDNWSTNAVPADGDTVGFEGSKPLLYDLNLAVEPAIINKPKTHTGLVGLPVINIDNTAKPYREYRTPRYLTTDDDAGTATVTGNLEYGPGQGSGRFMWDSGAGQAVVNIFGKGSRVETGVPCILWKGSHASNVVNNLAGDLGIAFFPGETATVATLRNGDGPASACETISKSGVTLTTVIQNGGKLSTDSAITTATCNAGKWEHGLGTVTALTINGGTFYPLVGATITTLTVNAGGTFDASKGSTTFTITNTIQLFKGSRYIDKQGRMANPVFKLNACTFADVDIQLPPGKTFTPS